MLALLFQQLTRASTSSIFDIYDLSSPGQAVLSAGSIVNKQDGGSGRFCSSSPASKARALCSDRKAGPRNVRNCVQGIQEGNVSENLKLRCVQGFILLLV